MPIYRNFVSIYRNFVSIYRNFVSIYKNFVSIYKNFVPIYKNFGFVYKNFVSIYRNFVSVYKNCVPSIRILCLSIRILCLSIRILCLIIKNAYFIDLVSLYSSFVRKSNSWSQDCHDKHLVFSLSISIQLPTSPTIHYPCLFIIPMKKRFPCTCLASSFNSKYGRARWIFFFRFSAACARRCDASVKVIL